MATRPAVVIPWRAGCSHREIALAWVTARYRALGWPVYLGEVEGPWRKAVGLQRAIETAEADVLVVADADVWCDEVANVVDLVATGQVPWGIPHLEVARLDAAATLRVIHSGLDPATVTFAEKPYRGRIGGGMAVIPRDLWDACPMDPRFVGWGQEDESWGHALLGVAGRPARGRAPLWHLWHPPQPRRDRGIGSAENLDLCRRYLVAGRHPDQLAELLAEARSALEEVPA